MKIKLTSLFLSMLLLLTACGGNNNAGNTDGGGGGGSDGGVIIVSTKEPSVQPTAEPTEEPTPEPTQAPTRTGLVTLPVDMSDLETYTYDNDLFSLEIPSSWSASDLSTDQEILVRFIDENENGVIGVNLFDYGQEADTDILTDILNRYLDSLYSTSEGYSRNDAVVQNDGSVLVTWGYDFSLGTKTARLLGNTFIEQKDTTLSLMTIGLPEEQFNDLESDAARIVNSYSFNPVTDVATMPSTSGGVDENGWRMVEVTDLETYDYETGLFSIDIPQGWTLQDSSTSGEAIHVWLDPSQNALIVTDIFEGNADTTDAQLSEILTSYLESTFGQYPDFQMGDVSTQSDGSQLIVWSYTATAGNIEGTLLGNTFIEKRGSYISLLSTVVPDAQFDHLLEMTNEIINSYVINTEAPLP